MGYERKAKSENIRTTQRSKNLMLWFKEIKRLMPEVEAIISQMGGVGAAPRNEKFKRESDLELKAKEIFHKNLKR